VVSGFEPSDHVWHRGLWFTIKLINGENFWEENAPFGVQRTVGTGVSSDEGGKTTLSQRLNWQSEASGVVIEESREMVCWDDATWGGKVVDFSTRLKAMKDLNLDRTPYTTWGGYGGLSFRASREMHKVVFETEAGEATSLAGVRGPWLVMRGLMDGGRDRRVSMGVVDHPENVRTPTPWYAKTGDGFTFWNAAVLFHEPMPLKAGEVLTLRYRVVLRDGEWGKGEFAKLAEGYRKQVGGVAGGGR
jgi:hypothetical protein